MSFKALTQQVWETLVYRPNLLANRGSPTSGAPSIKSKQKVGGGVSTIKVITKEYSGAEGIQSLANLRKIKFQKGPLWKDME